MIPGAGVKKSRPCVGHAGALLHGLGQVTHSFTFLVCKMKHCITISLNVSFLTSKVFMILTMLQNVEKYKRINTVVLGLLVTWGTVDSSR